MRSRVAVLALLLLPGCAGPKTQIRYAEGMDLGRYRKIGVLPFVDKRGRGRGIAAAIVAGLPARGFEVVATGNLEKIFARFRPDAAIGLGITELAEIKQETHAQALVSGSVDQTDGLATIMVVETDLGDEILSATLFPGHRGPFRNAQEIVDQALNIFGDAPARRR